MDLVIVDSCIAYDLEVGDVIPVPQDSSGLEHVELGTIASLVEFEGIVEVRFEEDQSWLLLLEAEEFVSIYGPDDSPDDI